MFLLQLIRRLAIPGIVVFAISTLQIHFFSLIDLVAAAFVLVVTLAGLIASTKIASLKSTARFLLGNRDNSPCSREVHQVLVIGCVFSATSGAVFSILRFIEICATESVQSPFFGTAFAFSILGLLYGLIVLLLLLPALFRCRNELQ